MKALKKLAMVMGVLAFMIVPCVLFGACGGDHNPAAGDVYKYSKMECSFPENFDWTQNFGGNYANQDEFVTETSEIASEMVITIKENNKVEVSGVSDEAMVLDYTIENNQIVCPIVVDGETVGNYTLKISGNTLQLNGSAMGELPEGVTTTIIFELSK